MVVECDYSVIDFSCLDTPLNVDHNHLQVVSIQRDFFLSNTKRMSHLCVICFLTTVHDL